MKRIFAVIPIAFFIMCSSSTPGGKSMEKVKLSINGLKKIYLDTTESGVTLEILFYDPWIEERDSIQYYIGELDQDFNPIIGFQGMYMAPHADTLLRKVIHIPFDNLDLPYGVVYEVGAVYLIPPINNESLEWEQDTVINEYFAFHVYDDQKEYQQVVDSFGLEPTVFVRE